MNALQMDEIIGILTLITLMLTSASAFIKSLTTSEIEELLQPNTSKIQNGFVRLLLSTLLLYFVIFIMNTSMLEEPEDLLVFYLYTMTIVCFALIVIFIFVLINTHAKDKFLKGSFNLFISVIAYSGTFVVSALYKISWGSSFGILICIYIITWIVHSFVLYIYKDYIKLKTTKTKITTRMLEPSEVKMIFPHGMFVLSSIQSDMQIVTNDPSKAQSRNHYPVYVLHVSINQVQMFNKDESQSLIIDDSIITPRKEIHK